MKDAFGTDIQQFDTVVWANRQGSSMWLSRGTVVDVYPTRIVVERKLPLPERRVTLHRLTLSTVVRGRCEKDLDNQ